MAEKTAQPEPTRSNESGRSSDGAGRRVAEADPRTLSQIGNLTLRARIVADSALSGIHRSRSHGTSVEFAEHKEYSAGDDVRHLDWRAFARFDRDFIKRFEDETALRALLVVDTSGTMGYPPSDGGRLSKLDYAKTAAGALAFVLARQGDATGLASFADRLAVRVPPRARRGHLAELLGTLEGLEAGGPTQLQQAVDALSQGLSKRTVVVLFSDLLDGGLDALPFLARLRARKHDVVLFHTLDVDELDFPFEESTLFTSLESDDEVKVDARDIRRAYLDEMDKFRARAETACRRARVEYHLARTDRAPGDLLAGFLAGRAHARRMAR